jgi:CDP-4-dehydro-6-deoxyglucose reductase
MRSGNIVTLKSSDGEIITCSVFDGETILLAFDLNGYVLHASCKGGGCGICKAQVAEGRFEYIKPISVTKVDALEVDSILLCRATPLTDMVIDVPVKWFRKKIAPFSDALKII